MDPVTWRAMVDDVRLLESSLGHGTKEVQENEKETVVLQRRAIRTIETMSPDDVIERRKIQFQRTCPPDAISVNEIDDLLGKKVIANIESGDYLRKEHIGWK